MKNRSFLITIITLLTFLPQLVFSANQYYAGDTLYVWARSGLNMRDSADIKARKIQTLPFGTLVIVQDSKYPYEQETQKIRVINSRTIDEQKHPGYSLNGNWIKVIAGDTVGYLFDGFLSKMLPSNTLTAEIDGISLVDPYQFSLVYFEQKFEKLSIMKSHRGSVERRIQRTIFENGAIHEYLDYNGSGGINMLIPDIDIEEAYLFLNTLYYLEKSNSDNEIDPYEPYYVTLDEVSENHLQFTIDRIGSMLTIKKFGNYIMIDIEYAGC